MPTIHEQQPKLEALKRELEAGGEMNDTDLSIVLTGAQIDAQGLSWIEVMPTAEKARNGPMYFTVTAEDLGALAEYIQANPDRIPIDRDHSGADDGGRRDTRAAGWFTGEAKVVQAGEQTPAGEVQDHISVWAEVKWTPAAVSEIEGGEFRFISAEWGFADRDPKSGLMTGLVDLAAATLTNRPFFKNMAPVTASEISEEDALHGMTGLMADEVFETISAAVWTTSYINDLPDSAFLYVESGEKDSDGKTTPRSLRHFPVRDANGSVDVAHVRNALARIPQSNVPASAKASATAAAERLLKNAGGNPSAADQGDNKNGGTPVSDNDTGTEQVTDYMRMLGLDDTVDPKHRLAAAFRDKDEKILALEQKVTELTAAGDSKGKYAEELASRIEELEQKDRQRDITLLLARATDQGKVLPAEKETLAEVFSDDVNSLKRVLASRAANQFTPEPKGTGSEPDRFADEPDVAEYVKGMDTGGDPVDTEQAKQHLLAMEILKEQGKSETYTNDEYVAAYTRAASLVY